MSTTTKYEFETDYGTEGWSGGVGLTRAARGIVSAFRETLREWYLRATLRPQLARLNDHKLRDIGLTRAEAEYEAAKPFWQA